MNGSQHRARRELAASIGAVLDTAQQERPRRQSFVAVPDSEGGGREFGWVVHEQSAAHAEVNRLRARAGLPPVSIEQVRLAERTALGHVDYSKKFALACADLVIDGDPAYV